MNFLRTAFLGLLLILASSSVAQPAVGAGRGFGADAVFAALEQAYPNWVAVRRGFAEPVLWAGGKEFVWAEGRLLPPEQASRWADFAPQPFYEYPAQIPDVASWSDAQVAEAEARIANRRSTPLRRSSDFFDAVWQVYGRGSADDAQKRIRFLGLRVTVHQSLVVPLARVEARLLSARDDDRSLAAFLKSLTGLDGYNWRDIAETQSRSNHAYGAAIDLIAGTYRGRNPYWLWAARDDGQWYRAAWARRWEPHPAVVQAFESEGFVWGGKWLLFDTIHFEYRPEILVLNKLR